MKNTRLNANRIANIKIVESGFYILQKSPYKGLSGGLESVAVLHGFASDGARKYHFPHSDWVYVVKQDEEGNLLFFNLNGSQKRRQKHWPIFNFVLKEQGYFVQNGLVSNLYLPKEFVEKLSIHKSYDSLTHSRILNIDQYSQFKISQAHKPQINLPRYR